MGVRIAIAGALALVLTVSAHAQAPAPGSPPQAAPAPATPAMPGPDSLLSGGRGDASNVDEVTLALKPAVMTGGTAKWDNAMETLDKVFESLGNEARKAGLNITGRPLVRFVETTDDSFRYEAMLPVDRAMPGQPNLTPDIRFTETPSGKALRFTHKAPYDDIDSTYEVLTAYLDAKSLEVQDNFVEEYVSSLKDADRADFELNIYVQPK